MAKRRIETDRDGHKWEVRDGVISSFGKAEQIPVRNGESWNVREVVTPDGMPWTISRYIVPKSEINRQRLPAWVIMVVGVILIIL